jgi:signal recognition particle subunit SRP72
LARHAILARLDQLLTLQPSASHSQNIEALINEQKSYLNDHPSDVPTHAVLAALYSFTSPAEAAQHSSHLPSVSSFTNTVDAQQLESQGIPSNATAMTSQKRKSTHKTGPRKRRVRGGKVFDSSQTVDPERWLPLKDRSYYKPLKTKKRKVGGATQGGAVEAETMSRTGSGHVEAKKADVGKKKKKGRK